MFEEAIGYPTNRDDWVKQLVIGGSLMFLFVVAFFFVVFLVGFISDAIGDIAGVLVIPGFIIALTPIFVLGGYLIDVLRKSEAGDDKPPGFSDFDKLLVDGIKATLILFVYYVIFFVVFGIMMTAFFVLMGVGFGSLAGAGEPGPGSFFALVAASWIMLLLMALLFFLFGIMLSYVLPAAFVNFAKTNRVSAGFDFVTIKDVLLTSDYFVGWLIATVIMFAVGIIVNVLFFTFVGIILVPFIYFYAFVVTNNLYGRAFSKASA